MGDFRMLPPAGLEQLLTVAIIPEPYALHFPLKLTELQYLELAHRWYSLGINVEDFLEVKVKKIGHHRMFIIKGHIGGGNEAGRPRTPNLASKDVPVGGAC